MRDETFEADLGRPLARENGVIILDFETTGLSPALDRAIEVAAVLLVDNQIVGEFTQLMNPGGRLPTFITAFTGITEVMLRGQPRPELVMPRLREFIGDRTIIGHNVSFDGRFLAAEMKRAGLAIENDYLCTMRLARRLAPGFPSYKLTELVSRLDLHREGQATHHRALADVHHTIALWRRLHASVAERTGLPSPPLDGMRALMRTPVKNTQRFLESLRDRTAPRTTARAKEGDRASRTGGAA